MKRAVLLLITFATLLSCKDDQKDVEPIAESASAELKIVLTYNGDEVSVYDTLNLATNEKLYLSLFKVYLSELRLEGNAEAEDAAIKEVLLFDPAVESLNNISAEIPEGSYESIHLGFGLNQTLNDSDPTTFENDHPLASYQSMYWDMMKYRFARIEGDYILNDSVVSLSYHPGTDPLFETANIQLDNTVEIVPDENYSVVFEIELTEMLNGIGGKINLPEEATSHSVPDDIYIATKLMKNLAGATTVSILTVEE